MFSQTDGITLQYIERSVTPECDLVVLVYRPDRIRSPISAENEHGDPYRATAEDEIAASTPRRNGTKVTLARRP